MKKRKLSIGFETSPVLEKDVIYIDLMEKGAGKIAAYSQSDFVYSRYGWWGRN